MQPTIETKCGSLLAELGLVEPGTPVAATPLTGGVASDIAMVIANGQKYCVKFALPKLKVKADWFAPVHRNAAEYAWLEVAADVAPDSAIRLFGRSETLHGFAMEFLEGDDTYLWKSELLAEAADKGEAARVGDLVGRVHAASAKHGFDASAFQNRDDFQALRIEPYLVYTASKHKDLASPILKMADQLYNANQVLVHGDVSPKNILFRSSGPVILDAECATMGDACFDTSFCLNHLILKAIHLPGSRDRLLANVGDFWRAYARMVSWEPLQEIEIRICKLLPMLMLGRVDGKSPVEYLVDREREQVRKIAHLFIKSPAGHLGELVQGIAKKLSETS